MIADTQADERVNRFVMAAYGIRSVLAIPLLASGREAPTKREDINLTLLSGNSGGCP